MTYLSRHDLQMRSRALLLVLIWGSHQVWSCHILIREKKTYVGWAPMPLKDKDVCSILQIKVFIHVTVNWEPCNRQGRHHHPFNEPNSSPLSLEIQDYTLYILWDEIYASNSFKESFSYPWRWDGNSFLTSHPCIESSEQNLGAATPPDWSPQSHLWMTLIPIMHWNCDHKRLMKYWGLLGPAFLCYSQENLLRKTIIFPVLWFSL